MSAAWDQGQPASQPEKVAKRFIRLWLYLAIAGVFLCFVAYQLNIKLF